MALAALLLCGSLSACYPIVTLVGAEGTDLTKKGEVSGIAILKQQLETNLTKQCIYNFVIFTGVTAANRADVKRYSGSRYIRTVQKNELCPQSLSIPLGSSLQATNRLQATNSSRQSRIIAFFKREEDTGGMTKQCIYDYLGSAYTLTVQKFELCPLNAQFSR